MNVMFLNDRIVQDARKTIGDMENDFNSYISKPDFSVSWAKTIETRHQVLLEFFTKAIQTITKLAAGANAIYVENHTHQDIFSNDNINLKREIDEKNKLIGKYETILKFHNWNLADLEYYNLDDWKEMKRQARINEVMKEHPELF